MCGKGIFLSLRKDLFILAQSFYLSLRKFLFILAQGKLQQPLFYVAGPGLVTDLKGEIVEGKTLLAGDRAPLCVVGPRREHE